MEINISIFKHFTQEQFLLYCIIVQLSLIDTCSSTNWHLKLMNTNFAVFIILKPIWLNLISASLESTTMFAHLDESLTYEWTFIII